MEINLDYIKRILKDNGELFDNFRRYSKVYLSTTENIKGIFDEIDIEGKSILTVAGSGDQALNAFFKGAREVTLFDINPLAFLENDLKFAGVSALDYKEFSSYFTNSSGNILNAKAFDKIAPELSGDAALYYDFLYTNYTPEEIYRKTIFSFYPTIHKLERLNAYMGEENFDKLKSIIKNKKLKRVEANVVDLPAYLEDKYDVMLLSNISDSLEVIFDTNVLKSYKRFIHMLSKHLNKEGIIQCGYIYHNYKGHTVNPIFANDQIRRKVFTIDEFNEKDVESYEFYSSTDKVITYQKKRRKAS